MSKDPETRLLILETSGRIGQVAVAEGASVLAERRLDETRRHARDLAPAVQELHRERNWKPKDIDAVIVSLGPGSYTGLRVGVMSAKAFAYATGCRLVGVETFPAIALQAMGTESGSAVRVEVIADAQQNKVYCQRFELVPGQKSPDSRSSLAILPVEEWLARLELDTLVTGPGLRLHRNLVNDARLVEESRWDPTPSSLLRLGLARLARGEQDPVFALEPLYARRSSAEEKWESRP